MDIAFPAGVEHPSFVAPTIIKVVAAFQRRGHAGSRGLLPARQTLSWRTFSIEIDLTWTARVQWLSEKQSNAGETPCFHR